VRIMLVRFILMHIRLRIVLRCALPKEIRIRCGHANIVAPQAISTRDAGSHYTPQR
jgi:hypothetical protein